METLSTLHTYGVLKDTFKFRNMYVNPNDYYNEYIYIISHHYISWYFRDQNEKKNDIPGKWIRISPVYFGNVTCRRQTRLPKLHLADNPLPKLAIFDYYKFLLKRCWRVHGAACHNGVLQVTICHFLTQCFTDTYSLNKRFWFKLDFNVHCLIVWVITTSSQVSPGVVADQPEKHVCHYFDGYCWNI